MPVSTDVTTELARAIGELTACGPEHLADSDTVIELHRLRDQLDAVVARSVAAFDAAKTWDADGARSAACWLTTKCRLPQAAARREVQVGRQLRTAPIIERAWLAGELGEYQASLLLRSRTPGNAEAFARDEEFLVKKAQEFRFSIFARILSYWRYQANADEVEKEAADGIDSREFHHSQSFGGRWFSDGTFDPIGGSIINEELKRLEAELFEEDWAEAKERLGDAVAAHNLRRTTAQRRADALVQMAIRSASALPGSSPPRPLFSVLVGYETFAGPICELANGSMVTPGSLVPWLTEAMIERVVFDGPSRVIDVGVKRRLFDGATRRAVELRDQECFHPFCEERAEACQIDHIEPYAAGGLTMQANGRVACDYHNRLRHRRQSPPVP
ncbi:MAG: DUF222 domain-containing protein [Actinobacteria bacterium]|nr:DUF222 domain-containing protein [Actinomycetota bacterium]